MTEFKITVCSDPEHEDLVAEMYYGEDFVGLISQEHGYDSLDLELPAQSSSGTLSFKLADFESAIASAKQRLWNLRRVVSSSGEGA